MRRGGAARTFLTNTAALVISAILSQGLNFLAALAVARLYGPVEVGLFGLFNAAFTLVVFAASWRYELAIVTVEGDQEASDIALFVIAAGVTSAVAFAAGLAVIELLPSKAGLSASVRAAFVGLPPSLLLASATMAGTQLCTRQRRFGRIAIHQLAFAAMTAAAQIGLVGVDLPFSRLVTGFVVGQFAAVFVFADILLPTLLTSARKPVLLSRLTRVAKDHRGHFLYTVPYSLVTQFYFQLPLILLGSLFSAKEAGWFSLAFRTTFAPITMVPTAFAQVLFPELARDRDRLDHWEPRLLALLMGLGVLMAPAVAAILVFGPDLYELGLGHGWREAGAFAQLLIFSNLLNGIASGYDRLYFVLGRLRTALAVMFTVSILSLLLMFASFQISPVPLWLVGGWAVGHLVTALAWMATIYRVAGFSLLALTKRLAAVAAFVAALAAAMIGARNALPDRLWLLVLLGTGTALVYGVAMRRTLWPLKTHIAHSDGLENTNRL
jgi:O-antigen/teichoic acid export membrane protein